MKIKVLSCTAKGKRCIALAKDKVKWVYDAHSDAEAELLSEAVVDRGWISDEYWRELC